ncbi:dihydropteroate synthase [Halorubrum ezzemoulense]|uniref:dihydropteroate synthase n=1 Tax=Halorubrum ezzemoulense TaxID=337243 RepID=UPI002330C02C|nr:dihydropteroate synthase [Halorubrum ezzemoulense]MDB9247528.1 dihydropteroate synthase [Halorubrum ezzemoulense]MDB9258563.1 dihydropteroate synthase [Halorubrum ezzemoulense]MDB9261075.1 dihydropteroate synthase [Halorubrum ezzemoulense]MDB9264578.1 dihydropteroate synthase [Halorubrum ezzemoulense]MDB9268924.1 dihydropteroate synthase [Halorubrum ezzemoulense]
MRNVDAAGLGIGDDHPPRIMGVLNVSEESPYDPSVYDDPGEAAAYVDEELIGEGADIVDVGLESANKDLDVLSAEQELDRLDTAVETLESTSGDAVWSIETRYHEVADEALSRGFDMVNDICGFADPEMPHVCREHDVAVSKMASPPDLERPGAVEDVDDIYEALSMNGLTDKTILDPAFGGWSEAKTHEDDRETFHRLREFRGYGRPLLVSINRKSFLKTIAGRSTEEALPVSLAATSMAVERGAHVIRTHDVAETRDAALVGAEFARDRHDSRGDSDAVGVEELDVTTVREAERHLDRIGAPEAARGDRGAADTAVVRTYKLTGLDDPAVGALRAATVGDDATGATFALGDPNRAAAATPSATDGGTGGASSGGDDPADGRRGLLIATPAALDSVREAVSGASRALDAAIDGIDRHVN